MLLIRQKHYQVILDPKEPRSYASGLWVQFILRDEYIKDGSRSLSNSWR